MSEKAAVADDTACEAREGGPPRVLFVSVNPFSSTSNNGKTFASFFAGYPENAIAQLYFHREIPSSAVCRNYFRLTDEHLLQSLPFPWRATGERVTPLSSAESAIPPRAHSALKRSWTARVARQLLWTTVRLENPSILAWLDEFRPEIIFFCGGNAWALYSKVSAIADRYNAKLAYYITDDYVLRRRSLNPAAGVERRSTRRAFRRIVTRADLVLTIGESMQRRYWKEFGLESVPVMNMVDVPSDQPELRKRSTSEPLRLLYAGSTHSNRWRVLARLTDCVEQLSRGGLEAKLAIYGPRPSEKILQYIDRPPASEFGGLLAPEELASAIADADVLVHVEADDPRSIAATALSVSTKIPEYLASGRPILAVGPLEVASIEYLASNGAALVVRPQDTAAMLMALEELVVRPDQRQHLANRGFMLVNLNHDAARSREMLWARLRALVR